MAAISQDDRAYRRGVVFGFTVAEVVLLLVFCLLLLFVPLLLDDSPVNKPPSPTFMPVPSTSVAGGGSGGSSQDGTRRPGDSAPNKEPADKSHPAIGDPSAASKPSPATPQPLPEGWILVAPNTANPNTSSEGSHQPKPPAPSFLAADPPFEALPLASVCERLGISVGECTAGTAEKRLSTLGRHNWPPIIKLKEADGFYFIVGQARVSEEFRSQLSKDVVPRILELVAQYKTNVIEIVGHTDEQPVLGVPSNLDKLSMDFTAKGESAVQLTAADNAGLGFARALAVVQILRSDGRLKGLTIVPLSAAQMVDLDGKLADGSKGGDTKERRRIELRVRQSGEEETVSRSGR
jgi:outer membrane protein OmpA-like peptidoglycan-associated protein